MYIQAHAYITHTHVDIALRKYVWDQWNIPVEGYDSLDAKRLRISFSAEGKLKPLAGGVEMYLYLLHVLVHTHHYQVNKVRNPSCLPSYCTYM